MRAMTPPGSHCREVAIVLPPVWSHVYLSTASLLKLALEDLGLGAEVVEYDGVLDREWSVLLGWSLLERPVPPGSRYILYQLEPLSLPHWQERLREKRSLFERASAIWDYSRVNLPLLGGLPVHWVPLGYHPRMREVSEAAGPLEHDVLFVGFLSPRRRAVLEALAQRCAVSLEPRWGPELRAALARAKVVLNIHQYDVPTPLEQPRVAYALTQGAFVLTEDSADAPYDTLVTVPYDGLIDAALHWLHHPRQRLERQQRTFNAFASVTMTERLRQALPEAVLSTQREGGP